MTLYARIYRAELQELSPAPAFYRQTLRALLTAARFADQYPRISRAAFLAASLSAIAYIFFNYQFTTHI